MSPTSTRRTDMPTTRTSPLGVIVRLLGFIVTIGLLDQLVDWEQVFAQVFIVPAGVFTICVLLALLRVWITGVRWRLMNPDRGGEISSWSYFRFMMISATCNLFLPGALGGDIARSFILYNSDSPSRFTHILSIAADRYVGLLSILILGLVAILALPAISGRAEYLTVTLFFITTIIGGTWALISELLPRLARRLLPDSSRARRLVLDLHDRMTRALEFYRDEKGHVAGAFALCLPIHLISFGILYVFAFYDGIEISFLTLASVSSLVWVISAIPISISGLGLRELSFVYLLSLQGVTAEAATALSLQFFAISVVIGVLGAPLLWSTPSLKVTTAAGRTPGTGANTP
jgi:uncharacterized protein (TIRG00374 family)